MVLLHRPSYFSAGYMIELDCDGRELRRHEEMDLVAGIRTPVLVERDRAQQWTGGIAAIPGGFVMPVQKNFARVAHRVKESYWTTEFFVAREGEYLGSTLVYGQWTVMDFHPGAGLLMTTYSPVPHFIVVPPNTLALAALRR